MGKSTPTKSGIGRRKLLGATLGGAAAAGLMPVGARAAGAGPGGFSPGGHNPGFWSSQLPAELTWMAPLLTA